MLRLSGVVSALISVLVAVATAQFAPSSAERISIARARRMYYSLQRYGVRDLRCNARPDWPQILASNLATSAEGKARALPYLSKIEFRVMMTASGTNVTVKPTGEQPPKDLAANLNKLIELVRLDVQQPLDIWRMMTFRPLLPGSEENYRLEHRGGRYKITSTGVNAGQIELDENWIVQEVRTPVPSEGVTVSTQPHYAENPNGLLLSSFDVRDVDEPSQEIRMTMEYLEREGLLLPAAFGSKSQHPGGVVSIPVRFDDYEIGRTLTGVHNPQ
jgi:hypothetical protein